MSEFTPLWATLQPEKAVSIPEAAPVESIPTPIWTRKFTGAQNRRLHIWEKDAFDDWFNKIKSDYLPYINAMGFLPNSDSERTAMLLMIGFLVQDIRIIHKHTNWPIEWLRVRYVRAREYGIWCGSNKVKARWLDYATNGDHHTADVEFVMQVMIMNGDAIRNRNKTYQLSDHCYQRIKNGTYIST